MIKKLRILFFVCLFHFIAHSQILWQFKSDSLITWHYQEGDEFNGSAVNTDYWSDWYGWGRSIAHNKEQQYYSKYKNHFLNNGILTLTAKREDVVERYVDWMSDNDSIKEGNTFQGLNKRSFKYTAGMLQSKNDFVYGYFEIKFKTPPEPGFWPAFWLYGGSPNEEIDWMELKTEKDNKIHIARYDQNKKNNYVFTLAGKMPWGSWLTFNGSFNSGYNVVSGIWTANELRYFLNGECIAIAPVTMKEPKKLVINMAVPQKKGAFSPGPPENFKDSVKLEVDYIRVFTRNESGAKRTAKQVVIAEPVSGAEKINQSSISSKSKKQYGKKSQHKNEGFFVSFFQEQGSKYQLSVLGKDIPANARYTLIDSNGQVIANRKLEYGVNTLDLITFQSQNLRLMVQGNNHKAEYAFTVQ